MKNLFYLISCALLTVFISSCASDPCEDVICQNGGTCMDGACDCPSGWTGASCETFDFEYVGEYESTKLSISDCNNSNSNGSLNANSDNKFCTPTDSGQECLRVVLRLKDDMTYRVALILTRERGGLSLSTPTIENGSYTINQDEVEICPDSGDPCTKLKVNSARTALDWQYGVINSSNGCFYTFELTKE